MNGMGRKTVTRRRLGMRIRQLRTEQHLSQVTFSYMLSMNRGHLIDIEMGRCNVSLDTLTRVAEGLGVHIYDLVEGIDE